MKVAIVFDWLITVGGAERVLAEIIGLYPDADIFAVVDFLEDRTVLGGRPVTVSFIQSLPFARSRHRTYLPLMPLAVEQWDFSAYDLVLSSSYAVAKGIITGPDQLHLSYVHTPMRYAWDLQGQYLTSRGLGRIRDGLARLLLHRLRLWDYVSAQRPDRLMANSGFIARRIRHCWRRQATVVYPPVDTDRFQGLPVTAGDAYLSVCRLVPYKRVDLMVRAFSGLPDRRLDIVGEGPELRRLQAMAPANVRFLGALPDAAVARLMAGCRAYLLAAVEDFGIAPIEAQAAGKPVIALAKGAAPETLAGTAVFFSEQTPEALRAAVEAFEQAPDAISAEACRVNAARFSRQAFRQAFRTVVEAAIAAHATGSSSGGVSSGGVSSGGVAVRRMVTDSREGEDKDA